jgi:hypothetical protein
MEKKELDFKLENKPKLLFDPIFEKTIVDIHINEHKNFLKFIEDNGEEHVYNAEADCCSNSYLEGFVGLIPESGIVFSEQKLSETYEAPASTQEYDQITPISISGKYGRFSFTLRNSSNGYYSGWLQYYTKSPDEKMYDYFQKTIDEEVFKSIFKEVEATKYSKRKMVVGMKEY